MINCDETPFFKKEILVAAIALSNSGGGTVFAEGEVLADKSLRHKIVDYIAENSLPSVFVLSDVLFPETHIKFTVPTVENHSATLWGDAFGISKNGKTERLFQKRAIKLEEAELTVEEDFRKTFDTETVEKVAERLSKTRKYKNIDLFEKEVVCSVLGALRYDGHKLLPTVWGVMLFGKEDAVHDLCPYTGAVYSLYGPKREKTRTVSFENKNLFSQREEVYYEIVRDNPECRRQKDFYFIFSHAYFTAISLRDIEKQSPVRIFNRNGKIEITFPMKKNKEKCFGSEKSVLSKDIGKVFRAFDEPFFRPGSREETQDKLYDAKLYPMTVEKREYFGKITVDFKHPLKRN